MNFLDAYHNFTVRLSRGLVLLAGMVLVSMMLLACSNMVLRSFWLPLKGTYELMGFLGALAVSLGMAHTQVNKGHIALTILSGVFPRKVEKVIDMITATLSAAFFFLVAWRGFAWSTRLMNSGELSETLRFAYYPAVMIMAFGLLILALVLVDDCLQTWRGPTKEQRR